MGTMTIDLIQMAREANADHVKTLALVMKDSEGLISAVESEAQKGQEAALKAARKLADDKAFTTEHQAKKIAETIAIEAAKGAAAVEVLETVLNERRSTFAAQARDRIDPSDAPILNYLKDALIGQLEGEGDKAILAAWAEALESGDKHAARVLRDFAPRLFRASPDREATPKELRGLLPNTAELQRQTAELLMSDDQRKAAKEVEHLQTLQARVQALAQNNHYFGMTKIVNGQLKVGIDAFQTGVRL